MKPVRMIGATLALSGLLLAQTPGTQDAVLQAETMPVFRVTAVSRTAKAISYQHRSGATKVDFAGTSLMPKARGEAKVESKQGYIEIEVEFDDLKPAVGTGGPEYLTYVLWAISPEGRTVNLGEVLLNGTKSKLNVTTELQVFGMMVTAEPYFSVTRPSNLMVMQSVVRKDTKGKVEEIDAKFELLEVGQYEALANPLELKLDRKIPLELYEARNAVQIARASGADRYASETFQKAEDSLKRAEAYQARKAGKKPVTMTARQAVQTAEDSRVIAVQRQEEQSLANEREAAAARELRAKSDQAAAESETERVTREAAAAELAARNRADRLRDQNEADSAEAKAAAARLKTLNDARYATDQATAARLRRENEAQRANDRVESDRLKRENDAQAAAARMEADRLKAENEAQRAAVQAGIDRAAAAREQAEADRATLRAELLQQFNAILETRDTARGLIVNMSDVLFDSAKFTLRPAAREKLAKVAGLVSGHAGLHLAVEGHTDSQGGEDYNQKLSEQRGSAVRNYLIEQGMAAGSISSQGFGKGRPVASNETGPGRQQNRRVEIVVSGEIIGGGIETPTAAVR